LRLDLALVDRGLARSRNQAAGLIDAGRVSVRGKKVSKASMDVADADAIKVRSALDLVSRAGFKLEHALEVFSTINPDGKTCLDVGASTGGFTQVLLNHGAALVVSVDVGHDQMAIELAQHPLVRNLEGFNARDLSLQSLRELTGDKALEFELVVADLSFISLELVLPAMVETAPNSDLLLLVKPQFEVGRAEVGSGVVTDAVKHQAALEKVAACAWALGYGIVELTDSGLPGLQGNIEYVMWINRHSQENPSQWTQRISKLVGEAL
jgi:23S rRNA (cytidine1920-2'-O)/16S rRNA (cytidine1409-2'-O)-methyltransferase